jgi:hypothetical protein
MRIKEWPGDTLSLYNQGISRPKILFLEALLAFAAHL